jgi:hypothetical protein
MGKRGGIDLMPRPCIRGAGDGQSGDGDDETDSSATEHAMSPQRQHNQVALGEK